MRCRDGMPKSKTNKGGYKSEGKYTMPYPPLHLSTLAFYTCYSCTLASVGKMHGWGFV